MKSRFAEGQYLGYEVHLRLDRVCEGEPYSVRSSEEVYRFMADLNRESAEFVYSLNCDSKNNICSVYLVGKGSAGTSLVDPKEVYKAALVTNSSSFILIHNHPSGSVEPSVEDVQIMKRINEGSKILGLWFLDSLITSVVVIIFYLEKH